MRRVAFAVAVLVLAAAASAGDRDLRRVAETQLAALERAAPGADAADTAQAAYDAARDLEEALRRAEPVSGSCRPLLDELRAYGAALRRESEGVDLPWPPQTAAARRAAERARARIEPARARCRPATPAAAAVRVELESPRDSEAFFGDVRAAVPHGTSDAVVRIGERSFTVRARDGVVRWNVPGDIPPGRYDLSLVAAASHRVSRGVWLLPRAARAATAASVPDGSLASRLRRVVRSFDGYSGIWVHDLVTGRTAGWNEDARFPAASTVKLALLVAALRHAGRRPEHGAAAYDLGALAGWSSNLATNRLLASVDPRAPQRVLLELGATSSTFTGGYRVGTAIRGAPNPPPPISSRVTTARDLGRILFLLQRGALGYRGSLRLLRLDRHGARVALGWLLAWSSPPPGDNAGNLRPAVPRTPLAQKNGWFSSVRHTAAIVYGRRGPTIVVLLTYRTGITLRDAQALGRRTVALLDLN